MTPEGIETFYIGLLMRLYDLHEKPVKPASVNFQKFIDFAIAEIDFEEFSSLPLTSQESRVFLLWEKFIKEKNSNKSKAPPICLNSVYVEKDSEEKIFFIPCVVTPLNQINGFFVNFWGSISEPDFETGATTKHVFLSNFAPYSGTLDILGQMVHSCKAEIEGIEKKFAQYKEAQLILENLLKEKENEG